MEQTTYSQATLNVTLEDASVLRYIRSIIQHTKGVVKVKISMPKTLDTTKTNSYRKAMEDKKNGRVTEWPSLEAFFETMGK